MSVLLVGNFLSSHTGTRSVCEDLSWRLANSGWHTIETSHKLGRLPRLINMVSTTLSHKREYQVAYVEVYSGLSFVWAEVMVWLLRSINKPVVLALHGGGLVNFAEKQPERVGRLLKKADVVVTPSLFLKSGLRGLRSSIRYIPNAIDLSRYEFRLRSKPSPRMVWLRAFHAIYQPELALIAMSYLVRDFEQIHLTLIGPDKQDGSFANFMNQAKQLGLRSRLSVSGAVPKAEIGPKLADADIFLNTTRFESFGVSVLEAAACGLPIVTTNVGELPYLWRNDEDALLVSPENPQEMADAVRRILTEPKLSEQLSRNARRKAEQFDWAVVLPQWDSLLNELLSHAALKDAKS